MSRKILAIDIRNDVVAAVLLNTGLKNSAFQTGTCVPIAPEKKKDDGLSSALEALFQQIDSTGATLVVAIPGERAFYRTVRMPFKDEKRIRQILSFELEPTLPVGIDNLVIDFRKGLENDQTEVLATAVEHEWLRYYLDHFNALDKHPQLVVAGSLPLMVYLLSLSDHLADECLLIEADHDKAMFFAVRNGNIALVRTPNAGSEDESATEAFALQVRQTLTAYSDGNGIDFSPTLAYLGGHALQDQSRRESLVKALDLPAEIIDLKRQAPKVEFPASSDAWNPWLMNNCLALALLEAEGKTCPSFHRSSSPVRDYWIAYRNLIKGPAILMAIVLLLGLGGTMMENHLLQKRVDQMDTAIRGIFKSAFPQITRIVDPLVQMRNQIELLKKNTIDPNTADIHVNSIDILNEISRLIPKTIEVHFNRMVVGGGSVTVSGDTAAFNVVDDIKNRLEKSDLFKSVTIASANMNKAGTLVSFKLKIDL
jgi:general secretion pathway protein L